MSIEDAPMYEFEIKQLTGEIERLRAEGARLKQWMGEMVREDGTDARRLRSAIVEARKRLAKGRSLWNGPAHECDMVLAQALSVENGADAISRAAKLSFTERAMSAAEMSPNEVLTQMNCAIAGHAALRIRSESAASIALRVMKECGWVAVPMRATKDMKRHLYGSNEPWEDALAAAPRLTP